VFSEAIAGHGTRVLSGQHRRVSPDNDAVAASQCETQLVEPSTRKEPASANWEAITLIKLQTNGAGAYRPGKVARRMVAMRANFAEPSERARTRGSRSVPKGRGTVR
jgi:hypothetical protein